MSEEQSGARETLEEARQMREHEDQAKAHDAAEQRQPEGSLSDDADRSEKPAPPGGMSNPSPSS
jgi:hypothetical protein